MAQVRRSPVSCSCFLRIVVVSFEFHHDFGPAMQPPVAVDTHQGLWFVSECHRGRHYVKRMHLWVSEGA